MAAVNQSKISCGKMGTLGDTRSCTLCYSCELLQTCTQWLSEFDFFTAANIIQPRLTQHWIKYRTYIEKPTRVPEHSTMT